MDTHELTSRLSDLARVAAGDPVQAVRVAGDMLALATALEQECARRDAPASHIFRIPGLPVVQVGVVVPPTALEFGRAGRIVGMRAVLRDFPLGDVAYNAVGLNFTWSGGNKNFVANGESGDYMSLAVLGAPANMQGSQIWYPLCIDLPASDARVQVQIQNQSAAPVTPDVYFAFAPLGA